MSTQFTFFISAAWIGLFNSTPISAVVAAGENGRLRAMARRHDLEGLIRWSQRDDWRADFEAVLERHVAPACEAAKIEVEDLPALIGDDRFMAVWGCAFEDFLARGFDDGSNIVDEYLKRRGWKETAPNRAYMAALRASTMSLYEVSGIVRGESFLARDLVRGGEPVRVIDRSGSRTLRPWDRLGARIMRIGERYVMGGGILQFSHDLADELLGMISRVQTLTRDDLAAFARTAGFDERTAAIAAGADATEILRAAAPVFSSLWLGKTLRAALAPETPRLENSEGEAIEFRTLRYGLRSGTTADQVRNALAAVSALSPASRSFWNWVAEGTEPRASSAKGGKGIRLVTTNEAGATVLGTVELEADAVTLSVNSPGRAERGRALLEPALGGLVEAPQVAVETVEQALTRRPQAGASSTVLRLPPEEKRDILHEAMDRHYKRLLDEPVPVLGGVTPRRAAETPEGREKVVRWLKFLENGSAAHPPDDPIASYDCAWLWRELGVADRRC